MNSQVLLKNPYNKPLVELLHEDKTNLVKV